MTRTEIGKLGQKFLVLKKSKEHKDQMNNVAMQWKIHWSQSR